MNSPPRLWWCPTGQFSFLPVHAAGIYSTESTIQASDYVVSSYAPSLKFLLRGQLAVNDKFKMTVVIQPNTPTRNPLPFTELELQSIEKLVPPVHLVKLGTGESSATVKDVLSHLPSSHIVHFACHGIQDAILPLDSGLILHDGERLKISEIMKLPMPNASLAFLNACETAMGTGSLPDEAIHLAASLLFGGFRGVVATMWCVFSLYSCDGLHMVNATGQLMIGMAQRLPKASMNACSETYLCPPTCRSVRILLIMLLKPSTMLSANYVLSLTVL